MTCLSVKWPDGPTTRVAHALKSEMRRGRSGCAACAWRRKKNKKLRAEHCRRWHFCRRVAAVVAALAAMRAPPRRAAGLGGGLLLLVLLVFLLLQEGRRADSFLLLIFLGQVLHSG